MVADQMSGPGQDGVRSRAARAAATEYTVARLVILLRVIPVRVDLPAETVPRNPQAVRAVENRSPDACGPRSPHRSSGDRWPVRTSGHYWGLSRNVPHGSDPPGARSTSSPHRGSGKIAHAPAATASPSRVLGVTGPAGSRRRVSGRVGSNAGLRHPPARSKHRPARSPCSLGARHMLPRGLVRTCASVASWSRATAPRRDPGRRTVARRFSYSSGRQGRA